MRSISLISEKAFLCTYFCNYENCIVEDLIYAETHYKAKIYCKNEYISSIKDICAKRHKIFDYIDIPDREFPVMRKHLQMYNDLLNKYENRLDNDCIVQIDINRSSDPEMNYGGYSFGLSTYSMYYSGNQYSNVTNEKLAKVLKVEEAISVFFDLISGINVTKISLIIK